jgi:enoyl-CoA hydratase/carnithine racemase
MSDNCLAYERRGAVAIVTIDDAPHNRMTLAFMDALESLVAKIASDAAIRAVVITAAGTGTSQSAWTSRNSLAH